MFKQTNQICTETVQRPRVSCGTLVLLRFCCGDGGIQVRTPALTGESDTFEPSLLFISVVMREICALCHKPILAPLVFRQCGVASVLQAYLLQSLESNGLGLLACRLISGRHFLSPLTRAWFRITTHFLSIAPTAYGGAPIPAGFATWSIALTALRDATFFLIGALIATLRENQHANGQRTLTRVFCCRRSQRPYRPLNLLVRHSSPCHIVTLSSCCSTLTIGACCWACTGRRLA
jgi:hypothetical protein